MFGHIVMLIFMIISMGHGFDEERILCDTEPNKCCYEQVCSQVGDSTWLPPDWENEGCYEEGCCQSWCQCFMGYSYDRDCGEPRVWDPEQFKCVEPWEMPACGVTTTTAK